jgi:hypothetical protein
MLFATLHMNGAIYKEKGLLTARGEEIKNKEEIFQLLEAVLEQSQVAVIHCSSHQRGTDGVIRGNCLAEQAAKRVAKELSSLDVPKQIIKLLLALELPPTQNYTKEK